MPKAKSPTKKATKKPEVAIAHRPHPLEQAIAKFRAAVERVLDLADDAARKLSKALDR